MLERPTNSLVTIRPPGGAGAILADPPVAFVTRSAKGEGRSPQHHYPCMSFDELAALAVADIAADHAFLFLWMPKRNAPNIEPLMRAWGFKFSGSAFTWVKPNKTCPGWFKGTGYGTRQNSEICWLGRRGSPHRKSKGVPELIVTPRREHSRKPDEQYERIEQFCNGPYVELFARQRWPRWIAWGNQVDQFPTTALEAAS